MSPTSEPAPDAGAAPERLAVHLAQCGPAAADRDEGEWLAGWLVQELGGRPADLVVLSELATTPFFSVTTSRDWQDAGETLESPGLRALAATARALSSHLLVPFAERGEDGALYNSSVIFGRAGEPVAGRYCSGPHRGDPTLFYRKVHLSENRNTVPGVHEKYFFRPGEGFVTYDLDFGRVATLICYDRSFPESWRAVQLGGARYVAVPTASSRPERAAMFAAELSVAAMQHGVFALAASKGGEELIDEDTGPVTYFGSSRVVSPFGATLAEGPLGEGPALVTCELDPGQLRDHARTYHLLRDRRPETYRNGPERNPWPTSTQ